MLYDITRTIGLDTLSYPGDEPPRIYPLVEMAEGAEYNVTGLDLHCHTGTHIDAPRHFLPGGPCLDAYPITRFVLAAHVIDTGSQEQLGPEVLAGVDVQAGEAVLFKTSNRWLSRDHYQDQLATVTPALAALLITRKVSLVGIDYLSIETASEGEYPVHLALMHAGVLILEDVDLANVAPGKYRLHCLPLKLHATEAAPCRAVLETL